MHRNSVASQFFLDHQEELAIQALKGPLNLEGIKFLSLLLRKQRDFDKEKNLIESYISEYFENEYIKKRYEWHQKSLFNRLVPRQPIHLPCEPAWIPNQTTLDQLCIVTGGDSKYFEFIVECIESIKNTRNYKNTQIAILDFGLSEQNIDYFKKKFDAKIIKPELIVDAPFQIHVKHNANNQPFIEKSSWQSEDEKKVIKFCAYKTCLPKIIPGFRYYLWIDSDAWIQDDRALDHYVVLCEKQGAAGSCHGSITFGNQFKISSMTCKNLPIAHPNQIKYMFDKHAITDGTFCVDAESKISKEWLETYQDLLKNYGFHWHHQEFCLTYLCHKYGATENVKYPLGFHVGHEGFPVVSADDHILRRPSTLEPVGIPHLVGSSKQLYLISTQKISTPLSQEQISQHKQICHYWFHHPHQKIVPNQTTTSLRFRVWPFDINEINEALNLLAQSFQSNY